MKKTSLVNRLLSIALCLCMVLSLMPASTLRVFAVDETTGSTDTAASYKTKEIIASVLRTRAVISFCYSERS